jgi:hypothetical protein
MIEVGKTYWFEYHCFESPSSSDWDLWLHSHQQCTVTKVNHEEPDMTEEERYEAGMLNHYAIKFKDGFEHEAGEDELYKDKSEFERPDPPKNLKDYQDHPEKWQHFD